MDPIYFGEDIRVTIQDLGWGAPGKYLARRDDLSSVAYWYQNLVEPTFPKFAGQGRFDAAFLIRSNQKINVFNDKNCGFIS